MKPELSKNTLFDFFAGRATSLQKKLVEEWLRDENNLEVYYEWLEEYERTHVQYMSNVEEALQQYIFRLNSTTEETQSGNIAFEEKTRRFTWIKYAAAVLLVISSTLYLSKDLIEHKTYSTGFGQVETINLADGSQIILNSNSSVTLPRFGFGSGSREVFLTGEAEFSVKHQSNDQKFLVHTPDKLEVEVVGTRFVVFSRARGSKVILNEGKVLLRSLNDTSRHTLSIKPGDVVTINKGIMKVNEKQPVEKFSAWKDHRFIFNKTPLEDIAFQLEENFGVKMQISDSLLAKRELTGTYEAENADELIDVLAKMLDVDIKRRGEKVLVNSRYKQ